MDVNLIKSGNNYTVFKDANGNGKLDSGESSATISFSAKGTDGKTSGFTMSGDTSLFSRSELASIMSDAKTKGGMQVADQTTDKGKLFDTASNGGINIQNGKEYDLAELQKFTGDGTKTVTKQSDYQAGNYASDTTIASTAGMFGAFMSTSSVTGLGLAGTFGGLASAFNFSNICDNFTQTMIGFLNRGGNMQTSATVQDSDACVNKLDDTQTPAKTTEAPKAETKSFSVSTTDYHASTAGKGDTNTLWNCYQNLEKQAAAAIKEKHPDWDEAKVNSHVPTFQEFLNQNEELLKGNLKKATENDKLSKPGRRQTHDGGYGIEKCPEGITFDGKASLPYIYTGDQLNFEVTMD